MPPVHADLIATPPTRPLVAASILSADFGRMADDCRDVLGRGADLLHLDVMDGHFVPNLTMGADMCRAMRQHFPDAYLDVHLMVDNPAQYVDMFARAGACMFTFHLELFLADGRHAATPSPDAQRLIDRVHAAGMHAGMAVNPPTPTDGLAPYLDTLDLVLVMSVNPGRSGQSFIPATLEKARRLSRGLRRATRLEMDGGLNPQTAPAAVEAGVEIIVSASALFGAADRSAVVRGFHAAGRPGRT